MTSKAQTESLHDLPKATRLGSAMSLNCRPWVALPVQPAASGEWLLWLARSTLTLTSSPLAGPLVSSNNIVVEGWGLGAGGGYRVQPKKNQGKGRRAQKERGREE